ncbi:regulator of G protein signaling superfamily [Polychaeton citri CBS 116435]|uniref:Regulator of G protein signaling superfamily n=1 Tax=Polychaeton citri CBS 116435 TaxID=1314669 RepID=A0A9P4UP66_9PEZI|nr:regulator of G protein signaling superfamily [Polychaeton citri CBS 116435]
MIVRKPSSSFTSSSTTSSEASSRKSSLTPPSALTDWDSDDEANIVMADEYVPSRPLSVAIPKSASVQGPYCPRRPNLREILSNTSSPPWTLAAFMAYLSNNHCLETLEFTMDAGRYRKHYEKMLSKGSGGDPPPSKDREYVSQLWHRLIDAYIQPNGSREVNLPAEVRDPILNTKGASMPPAPETLDPAVAKIYELMEESVLGPFLNSVYPVAAHPTVGSCPVTTTTENLASSKSHDSPRRHQRSARSSPPPQSTISPSANSYSHPGFFNRKSAPSTMMAGSAKARYSVNLSPATSNPRAHPQAVRSPTSGSSELTLYGSNSGPGMTDDSGSSNSPIGEDPLTPPVSPPTSDLGSPANSPRASRDSGMWKKLGRLSGMKATKKKGQAES